jgi:hypothetical protein
VYVDGTLAAKQFLDPGQNEIKGFKDNHGKCVPVRRTRRSNPALSRFAWAHVANASANTAPGAARLRPRHRARREQHVHTHVHASLAPSRHSATRLHAHATLLRLFGLPFRARDAIAVRNASFKEFLFTLPRRVRKGENYEPDFSEEEKARFHTAHARARRVDFGRCWGPFSGCALGRRDDRAALTPALRAHGRTTAAAAAAPHRARPQRARLRACLPQRRADAHVFLARCLRACVLLTHARFRRRR